MTPEVLKNVLQAAMLAAGRALSLDDFLALLEGSPEAPDRGQLREALAALGESLHGGPLELTEVASGYRLQVRKEYSPWLAGLFAERPPRYSRALLETLALIAYRQPITRGEIEDVRGVAVSSNIVKTLMEREWIRVLGHREVPGRPALFGTTREFLDHFSLSSLEGLPALAEIRDLDQLEPDLFASAAGPGAAAGEPGPESGSDAGVDPGAEGAGDVAAGGDDAPDDVGVDVDAGSAGDVDRADADGVDSGTGTGAHDAGPAETGTEFGAGEEAALDAPADDLAGVGTTEAGSVASDDANAGAESDAVVVADVGPSSEAEVGDDGQGDVEQVDAAPLNAAPDADGAGTVESGPAGGSDGAPLRAGNDGEEAADVSGEEADSLELGGRAPDDDDAVPAGDRDEGRREN